jgi:hypothetical protein
MTKYLLVRIKEAPSAAAGLYKNDFRKRQQKIRIG